MSGTTPDEVTDGGAARTAVVEVDTVLSHPVDHVWKAINTAEGAQALLGRGATLGGKGERWHAEDGTHGVWRSHHPLEQVRVSWHAHADAPRSLVDLTLAAEGEGTRVTVRHEHANGDPAALRQRWSEALARLDSLAT